MKVECINPFVSATLNVLQAVLTESPARGEMEAVPSTFSTEQLNVAVGVSGEIQGSVIFGMSLTTADRIASTMIGTAIKTFDQLAASAIAELSNMICGNALTLLAETGYVCDIAPPTLIRGSESQISTINIPAIVTPFKMSQGSVKLTVGLRPRK